MNIMKTALNSLTLTALVGFGGTAFAQSATVPDPGTPSRVSPSCTVTRSAADTQGTGRIRTVTATR